MLSISISAISIVRLSIQSLTWNDDVVQRVAVVVLQRRRGGRVGVGGVQGEPGDVDVAVGGGGQVVLVGAYLTDI